MPPNPKKVIDGVRSGVKGAGKVLEMLRLDDDAVRFAIRGVLNRCEAHGEAYDAAAEKLREALALVPNR